MNWSSDNTVDYIWYSINNGSSWTAVGGVNATSGTYTINGLNSNTTYNIKTRIRRKDSQLTTDSANLPTTTYQYPYVSAIGTKDLTIGNSQTLTLYNPLSRNVTVYMKKDNTNGTQLYSGTTTGTSITFTPDTNTLYQSISNSQSGNCVYYCIYSNQNKQTLSGTYKITGNEKPTFSNFNYADTNSKTVALTGNNQILVKGYSNNSIMIEEQDRAIAKNSASMLSYKVVQGSGSDTKPYSESSEVLMSISNVDSPTMTVSATDSRSLSTSLQKTAIFKNYSDVVIKSVNATRGNNGIGESVTLAFNGSFWNDNFGAVTNAIESVTYQYKETSSNEWSNATALIPTITNSEFNGSISIQGDKGANGFSVEKSFNIRLTVNDELSTKTFDTILGSGTPAIAIYKDNIAIGQKYDTSLGGKLQVNGKIFQNGQEVLQYDIVDEW